MNRDIIHNSLNRIPGIPAVEELNKREATRSAGVIIKRNIDISHITVLREQILNPISPDIEGQIPNDQALGAAVISTVAAASAARRGAPTAAPAVTTTTIATTAATATILARRSRSIRH
jgi:hypothetical protein